MDIEQLKRFMRYMGISLECPRCGAEYQNSDIKINSYDQNSYNLTLTCHRCATAVSASIAVSGNMLPRFLQKATKQKKLYDIRKPERQGVSEKNILEMHEFLKDFDGDFTKMLEK